MGVEYSDELANEILSRMVAESLQSILVDPDTGETRPGMPHYSTVMKWRRTHPKFGEDYLQAREDQGDYDADLIVDLRRKLLKGEISPEVHREAKDSCKWTAGRRKPKTYGDKLDLNVDGEIRGSITYQANLPPRLPPPE